MNHNRNVEGLRDNAQRKRQEAYSRTDKAIQQLLKERKTINFNTVAQASGVSKAWLYKEPDIKARIEHLREQNQGAKKAPPQQRTSDASKDALIKNLKVRIKQLEATNRELRSSNEVAYGQIVVVESLKRQVEHLQRENRKLKESCRSLPFDSSDTAVDCLPQQLEEPEKADAESQISSLAKMFNKSSASTEVTSLLSGLGITINTTLAKAINNTPHEIVIGAIETLKEAIAENRVKNPAGFLLKAIQDAWNPNENYQQQVELANFNEWYPLARSQNLVQAATQIDGIQYVLTASGEWLPFSQMVAEYPLENL